MSDEQEVVYHCDLHLPTGFTTDDTISWGITGIALHDEKTDTVVKAPLDDDAVEIIQREIQVYERLTERGGHPGILRYLGPFERGFRMEHAPNYSIRSYRGRFPVDLAQQLRWAVQVAEAMLFIHQAGVIHGDLTVHNIFVDAKLNAKVGDFGGSSIDGSSLMIGIAPNSECPRGTLSVQHDIFAYGSLVYDLLTGHLPYEGLEDGEIESRYQNGVFPETEGLMGGHIITGCWKGSYSDFGPVINDLTAVLSSKEA